MDETKQFEFLDLEGLTSYDELIKNYIDSTDNLTQEQIEELKTYVGAIPEGYDAKTVTEYIKEVADAIIANGYDDTEIKARLTSVEEEVEILNGDVDTEGSVDQKVEDAKEELTEAIAEAIGSVNHLKREIVDKLPRVQDADENTIYMVPKENGSENQYYDEYMIINGAFEKIGDTAVDLTDYATIEYVDTEIKTVKDEVLSEANSYTDEAIEELSGNISAIPVSDIEALFED